MPPISLYIHIPFCIQRCGYCDFNTYAGLQELIPAYSQAVSKELEYISRSAQRPLPVHTVYFGGGTPSMLPSSDLEHILGTVKKNFDLSPQPEITLEANPGTLTPAYLQRLGALGVNRLSLGMQSAHQEELALLERCHSYEDVVQAVHWARQAGIANLSLDLIFGLPGQGMKSWMVSVESALSLQPEHLSLYALTLEHGTPLQHKVLSGVLLEPDDDLAADMYESARDRLKEAGFTHYEISNWALPKRTSASYACQHNLQYWRTLPWLGVGAGAHGQINHWRTVNVAAPAAYIQRMETGPDGIVAGFPRTPATIQAGRLDDAAEMGEMMMMGLRLVEEGVSSREFFDRHGIGLRDKFHDQIERLVAVGLLEWTGGGGERLRLTTKGQLLGNRVFREFI